MTETSPVALGNPVGPARRTGSIGVPFPPPEVRVVDRHDSSLDLAHGEAGELLLRGPQVFSGYWERPHETAEVVSRGRCCAARSRTSRVRLCSGDGTR